MHPTLPHVEPSLPLALCLVSAVVEREDLTDDIVVNPSDGSCAQQ